MTEEKLVLLKEANLTNNCPECFNQDLKLSFYQKHQFGKLFHRITSDIQHTVTCNTCGSAIYPSKWTDDIERIFDYYKKTVAPEKTALKFTKVFYGLVIGLVVGLVSLLIFLKY